MKTEDIIKTTNRSLDPQSKSILSSNNNSHKTGTKYLKY